MHLEPDAVLHEVCEKGPARLRVHLDEKQIVGMPLVRGGQGQPPDVRQQLPVKSGDLPAAPHEGIQPAHLAEPQGAIQVRKPIVPPQSLHLAVPWPLGGLLEVLGVPRDAVAAEQPERVSVFVASSQDSPALGGRDVLHGMEAQDGHVGVEADLVPAPIPAQRVAGVLDQDQPVLGRQPSERLHGEWISAEADGRDGPDPALLRLLNFPQLRLRLDGVETEGARLDVRKDGLGPHVERGVRRRREGHGVVSSRLFF